MHFIAVYEPYAREYGKRAPRQHSLAYVNIAKILNRSTKRCGSAMLTQRPTIILRVYHHTKTTKRLRMRLLTRVSSCFCLNCFSVKIAVGIKSVDEVHRNGDSVNMIELNLTGKQLVQKMETTKASMEVSVRF